MFPGPAGTMGEDPANGACSGAGVLGELCMMLCNDLEGSRSGGRNERGRIFFFFFIGKAKELPKKLP